MGCSRGIIRNRASILSLLASLSEASASSSSSRQKTDAFPSLNLSSQNLAVTLRPSSRTGSTASSNLSGVSGYHPPLPPKPRSRPSSQHLDQADGEGRGSVDPGACQQLWRAVQADGEEDPPWTRGYVVDPEIWCEAKNEGQMADVQSLFFSSNHVEVDNDCKKNCHNFYKKMFKHCSNANYHISSNTFILWLNVVTILTLMFIFKIKNADTI